MVDDAPAFRSSVVIWEDLRSLARDYDTGDDDDWRSFSSVGYVSCREALLSEYRAARAREDELNIQWADTMWAGKLRDPCNPLRESLVRIIRVSEHDAVVEMKTGVDADGKNVWVPTDDELASHAYMTALLSYHAEFLRDDSGSQ